MDPGTGLRRVTIVDVAAHAQVSTTAVSKVMRNAYGVSPAMREKVNAAIAELGYRPRAAARGMRGRTYTIGVLLPDIRNPFFPEIVDGITDRLHDTEYQVMLGTGSRIRTPGLSASDAAAELRLIESMVDRGMDGMVLVAPASGQKQVDEVAAGVPLVVIGRHMRSAQHDTVVDDDARGAALVVDHLAGLGHRRIAHVDQREPDNGRSATMPNTVRTRGYRDAMSARGLGAQIEVVSTGYTEEGGYAGAQQLLGRAVRPTAIFAGADIVAMGVLTAVAEAGLRVPEDISVAGYDNTSFAALGPIGLTSVDQAGHQIGADAARLLLERMADRDRPSTFITTSPTLVVRRTTAAPPD
ncbi:LacI family transcriptional regulator [Kineosporia rhizophila]|uniref:LacI family DNA-binding transcriptional regulator n=1 Tax=Kineosporia TaxID=49184 RepID=UPI001E602D15|nr:MULTISPECIES: LacI family DNA-binding transcriptional regulator [Kineosporia]MCE0537479.1 LacI family transcriptional regulator [Kineosporia rhizophila]GLY16544.1 LacI family transcriptional regulator [Kineosporia sp. NBRC 101677]